MAVTWGRIWQNTIQAFVMVLGLAYSHTSYAESDAKAGAPAAGAAKIALVYGDSLSAAYNMAPEQGWVHWLGQTLKTEGSPWQVRNASVSGETTDGGLRRLAKVLDEQKPNLLILELGANDALRGLPLNQAEQNLGRMIELAKARQIKVLLVGVEIPPNYGPEYTTQFRTMFSALAKRYQIPLLPFLLEPIANARENFMEDNIHPTPEVQAQVGQHVLKTLKPLLD